MEIIAPSYQRCGRYLRLSDIYLAIRDVLDLSPLLEFPENQIWKEFKERLSPEDYNSLVQKTQTLRGVSGLYKLEHPIAQKMQGIRTFYVVRHKVYFSLISLEQEDGVYTSFLKKCLKGAVLRTRADCLKMADFFEFGDAEKPVTLQEDMRSICSKNWNVYFVSLDRKSPTIYCRKRYLLDVKSGLTAPHGFLSDE